MEGVARLFLAVPLPDEVRHGLTGHLHHHLDGRPLPGRPVAPENLHLTLRFLGWTEPVQAERLQAELDQADLGTRFPVRLGGLGAFPRAARATVVWVGLEEGREALATLAARAEEAVRSVGFDPEERPFAAHLTLSRLRPDQDVRPLLDRVPPFPARFEVDAVVLFESHLGRGGARYEELERFELR